MQLEHLLARASSKDMSRLKPDPPEIVWTCPEAAPGFVIGSVRPSRTDDQKAFGERPASERGLACSLEDQSSALPLARQPPKGPDFDRKA